jgi:hypothetical protein
MTSQVDIQVDKPSPSVFLFKNILNFLKKIITNKIFIVVLLVTIIGGLIYYIYNKKYVEHLKQPEEEPEEELAEEQAEAEDQEEEPVIEKSKKIKINHPKNGDYSNDYQEKMMSQNDKSYTEELDNIVGMLDNDKIDQMQAFKKSQELEPEIVGQHNLTNTEIMEINKKLEQY